MTQLKKLLEKADYRSVKKWLEMKGIVLLKEGRKKVVYAWCVELAIQLEIVECLRKQFPTRWHLIYEAATSNEVMKKAVFQIYHPKGKSERKFPQPKNKYFE